MDDAWLLARAHAGLVAQARLPATHGGTLVAVDGRLACVMPHAPTSSIDAVDPRDGEAAAVTFILDVDDDACAGWVATPSHARRRGLASGVLTGALRAAKRRGQTSTTPWASAMGAAVYETLGHRRVGHFHLWERRP